jgi:hypothetical protein
MKRLGNLLILVLLALSACAPQVTEIPRPARGAHGDPDASPHVGA